ncbi:MAG: STAS domain-containing protein [Thermotogaceae bacterium]|nr:STAS domain-containing protein [Thermotogaceae bacterium]
MTDFNMEFKDMNGKLVVIIEGDIDAYHSAEFKKTIKEKIATCSGATMVLDFSSVSYIDSAGLGSLVAILKEARNSGKNVVLSSLKPGVKRIFEMTRLDKVFKIVDTPEEA